MIAKQMSTTEVKTMRLRTLPRMIPAILFPVTLLLPHTMRAQSAPHVKGVCVEYCGSGSSTSSSSSSSSSRPTSWGETTEGRLYLWMKHKRQDAQQRRARELNQAGVSAYSQGRYADAAKLFRSALKHNPNDATIQGNLAGAQLMSADRDGQIARDLSGERSSEQARRVFDDRRATPAGVLTAFAVDGRSPSPSVEIPQNLRHLPEFKALKKDLDNSTKSVEKLKRELQHEEAVTNASKPDRQMQIAQTKTKLAQAEQAVTYKVYHLEVRIKEASNSSSQ
jgi:hypothetical protein